jgi:hypothetical protein
VLKIRAAGQVRAQETIAGTLMLDHLQYELCDSASSKLALLEEKLNVSFSINPTFAPAQAVPRDRFDKAEEMLSDR